MYEFRPIDPYDEKLVEEVAQLQSEVFPIQVTRERLQKNTLTRSGKTLYLGAFEGNELAAFNAFIGHTMQLNDEIIIAHQSCWTATSPKHRNKGLFSKIINSGKEILKQQGSAYIFGYPNVNSYPIFTQKLGFREIPLRRAFIPTFIFSGTLINKSINQFSTGHSFNFTDCYLPSDAELIEWKKNESTDVRVYGSDNNIVWGKRRNKKVKGININYFSIGGITINKPGLLDEVFLELVRDNKISYIEIIGMGNNSALDFFRYNYPAPKTEPLIIFDLNHNTENKKFNFYLGIKDVF